MSPLNDADVARIDAYWRAANYLSVGQIYLLDNPLLREPLTLRHIKPRLLGHFGTTPGLNLVYVHLNRVIRERGLDMIYIAGPGHGGPGMVANAYLEGTYSEVYPEISRDEAGMQRLFKQFSFPRRYPEPPRAGDPRLDARGRRAGLRALARVRRRLRQPRTHRRLCDRGR
jgi:xylulose-5-phosphate/fructose-6-phosphate phosphoketolase